MSFSGHYEPLDLQKFSNMLNKITHNTPYKYIFEPGKFIIAESGILLTSIEYIKQNNLNNFVIVDAGMNDLIRPSLYEAHHDISVITKEGVFDSGDYEADIVGPICETGCFLAKGRKIVQCDRKDLIVVHDAGAYGFSMASNYNSRRLPSEVLVKKDGSIELIRRRQTYDDLWKDEIL